MAKPVRHGSWRWRRWRISGFDERVDNGAAIDDALAAWFSSQRAETAAAQLLRAGIPAASLASSVDLVASGHLRERGFWEAHGDGVLPGLPWRASFGRRSAAPARRGYRRGPARGARSVARRDRCAAPIGCAGIALRSLLMPARVEGRRTPAGSTSFPRSKTWAGFAPRYDTRLRTPRCDTPRRAARHPLPTAPPTPRHDGAGRRRNSAGAFR